MLKPAIGHTRDGRLVREHLPYARPCRVANCPKQALPHQTTCYTHTQVSRASLYRVWAYISQHPQHDALRIAHNVERSRAVVYLALHELERRGVYVHDRGASGRRIIGARKIVEPFCWIEE